MKSKANSAPRGHDREDARPQPEFSRLVEVDDIPPKGLDLSIAADAAECAALGRRAGVNVQSLAADFHLRKVKKSEVCVEGLLRARVVQTCVVSLESFESDIETPIEVEFAETDSETELERFPDARGGTAPASVDLEAPDPIVDGRIDIGAMAGEFLMLALEPYPRKPGVSFEGTGLAESEIVSPFDALRALRGKVSDEK
jgi:hypothetical protein